MLPLLKMLIQLIVLSIGFLSSSAQSGSDDPNSPTSFDSPQDAALRESGLSRLLGLGYDIFHANPFTTDVDPGLKRNTLKPPRLFQFPEIPGHSCPSTALCLNLTTPEIIHIKIVAKSLSDYQKQLSRFIDFHGKLTTNLTDVIGILESGFTGMTQLFAAGTAIIDEMTFVITQEAQLENYRGNVVLSPAFASAVCELPEELDEVHKGDYISFLREYGTHVVLRARHANLTIKRMEVEKKWIRKAVLNSGLIHWSGNGTEMISLTEVPNDVIVQAALIRNQSSSAVTWSASVPVVHAVREISYFVTKDRLSPAVAESAACKRLFEIDQDHLDETYMEQRLQLVSANLVQALALYADDVRKNTVIPWTAPMFPVPKPVEDDCQTSMTKQAVKYLGLGYNRRRSNFFASQPDRAFHMTPTLLKTKVCTAAEKCQSSSNCAKLDNPDIQSYVNYIWDQQDLTKSRNEHLVHLDRTTMQNQQSDVTNNEHEQFPFVDKLTIKALSEVSLNYRYLPLDPNLIHAICELPLERNMTALTRFFREFGTDLVVKVRWGDFHIERTPLSASDVFDLLTESSTLGPAESQYGSYRTFQIHAAMQAVMENRSDTIDQRAVIARQNTIVHLSTRSIPYFVTLERLQNTENNAGCDHLQTTENVKRLQKNMEEGLEEFINPSAGTTPSPTTTTTAGAINPLPTNPMMLATTTSTTTTESIDADVTESEELTENIWPAGTYGLMEADAGCPVGEWHKGARYQDLEDTIPLHLNSNGFWRRTKSMMSSNGVTMKFCVKTKPFASNEPEWPVGSYCIFKKHDCPRGFTPSHVDMDDENTHNRNTASGTLPDGSYTADTRYYFCCRRDGFFMGQPISLPTSKPFFLLRNGHTCQAVAGMDFEEHFFQVDCEDTYPGCRVSGMAPIWGPGMVTLRGDFMWRFCYYKPARKVTRDQDLELQQLYGHVFHHLPPLPQDIMEGFEEDYNSDII